MRRILIIDDEDDIREVAAWALRTVAGWFVDTAASGPHGILRATAQPPDAILLDVSMPGMDGPATLRQVQLDPSLGKIPVLFLTAKSPIGPYSGLGAVAVLAKPFDPRTLARQISSALCWS